MKNKTIGIILLILPFVACVSFMVYMDGWSATITFLAMLLAVFVGFLVLMAGLYFYSKKD